jgi:hypothetical protein
MARIEASIEIAAPRIDVFRFCHNLDRRSEWDERVVDVEWITPLPVHRGSLIRVDAGRSGRFQFTWEAEYISYQLPSGSTIRVIDAAPSSPFKSGTEDWEFSQTAHGTRFTVVWEYQPRGFFSRISDVLGGRAGTRRAIRRSLDNLKNLIEAN